jgi:hypothetical protein
MTGIGGDHSCILGTGLRRRDVALWLAQSLRRKPQSSRFCSRGGAP